MVTGLDDKEKMPESGVRRGVRSRLSKKWLRLPVRLPPNKIRLSFLLGVNLAP